MENELARFWGDLADRLGGPLSFRLVLQPAIAVFFGIRDGLKDAKQGAPAYFWAILSDPAQRRPMSHSGWTSIAKVFFAALAIDAVYQMIVLRFVYPGEALVVAAALAIVPYLVIRGPVNRVARSWRRNKRAP